MKNTGLYLLTVLIWGSTWYVITFQLGTVAPPFSISYRFGLAALCLILWLAITKRFTPQEYTRKQHSFMALQGLCLFCLNYWLFYEGTQYLTSGLVAVIFSLITIMNIINQRIFFKIPVSKQVVLGSLIGLIGISAVFWPEIVKMGEENGIAKGLALCFAATYTSSIGNMVSLRNTRGGIPIIKSNSYGMAYGALTCFLIALLSGLPPGFDTSFNYLWSLAYLAILGSVIAFGSYLTLIKNIGADKAAYSAVLFPVIALILSTIFEDYSWSAPALIGMILIVIGNVIAMTDIRRFYNLRG